VAAQVRDLIADPEPFWAAVHERASVLQASSSALTAELARQLGQ
jgi:hypothetical protein